MVCARTSTFLGNVGLRDGRLADNVTAPGQDRANAVVSKPLLCARHGGHPGCSSTRRPDAS